MAAAVDVEGLFRKFTVAEVKDIEKKVKADVERKKEDLRQMVGRRYRDIIEAADSINEMQASSEKILSSIRRIEAGVERLHSVQQQLILAGQRAKMHVRPTIDSTESLAKCAADMLELAHDAAASGQSLEAAWHFMTADYMYRTWKLNCSQQADSVTNLFLEQRFRNDGRLRILKIAQEALTNSTEVITDAVCAVAFLERTSLDTALERFLECRTKALHEIFMNPDRTSREQICAALDILQKTVLQIHQLFAPSDGVSLALERIRLLVTSRWQPPLLQEYVKRQGRLLSIAFPDGLDCTKIFFTQRPTDAELSRVCALAKSWFADALKHSGARLSELVNYFDTIEALTIVRENVVSSLLQVSDTFDWNTACRTLLGEEVSLWHKLCIVPLENRVKELIGRDVNAAFDTLAEAHATPSGQGQVVASRDWWREQRTDTVVAGAYSTLQLKARGLTMDVHRPVSELDAKIGQVDSALSKFLTPRQGDSLRAFSFDDASIHETLAKTCVDAIEKFISNVNQKAEVWRREIHSKDKEEDGIIRNLILSAKLIQCFCDSAGFVRTCILRRYGIGKAKESDGQQDRWSTLRSTLAKCVGQLYRVWIQCILAAVHQTFDQQLHKAVVDTNFWIDHAQEWEGVQIEEETEDGQKVFSTIYVPNACSGFVTELLHAIGRCLVDVGAQSIHNEVLSTLSKSLRSSVVQCFEQALVEARLRQKSALQLIFDFNVLTQMMQSAADRDETTRIQQIIDRLGSFVDPFDLDVLKPHMKRNVAKVLQRWQVLYRVVYTPESLRSSSTPGKTTSSTAETPQLLPLRSGQNRFYLLPVVADAEKPGSGSTSVIAKNQITTASAAPDDGDKTRQQMGRAQNFASTFYDKLSSSWFGSN